MVPRGRKGPSGSRGVDSLSLISIAHKEPSPNHTHKPSQVRPEGLTLYTLILRPQLHPSLRVLRPPSSCLQPRAFRVFPALQSRARRPGPLHHTLRSARPPTPSTAAARAPSASASPPAAGDSLHRPAPDTPCPRPSRITAPRGSRSPRPPPPAPLPLRGAPPRRRRQG